MADAEDNDDVSLLEGVRRSDQDSFRQIFEKYQPVLFRTLMASVRNPDIAHEVVQETFVRVWNHRTTLRPHLPVMALLFRISRNILKDASKHAAVRVRSEAEVVRMMRPDGAGPDEALDVRLLEERLASVVGTVLPSKCREIFLLSRMEEMTNAEIGQQLGLSVKTVENQITRALRILRKHLKDFLS